jgi:hypothetical protein
MHGFDAGVVETDPRREPRPAPSDLLFDGYSRAIVGAGCFERQTFSRLS